MVVNSDEYSIVIRIVDVHSNCLRPIQRNPLFLLFIVNSVILIVITLVDKDTADTDRILPACRNAELFQELLESLIFAIDLLTSAVNAILRNTEVRIRVHRACPEHFFQLMEVFLSLLITPLAHRIPLDIFLASASNPTVAFRCRIVLIIH